MLQPSRTKKFREQARTLDLNISSRLESILLLVRRPAKLMANGELRYLDCACIVTAVACTPGSTARTLSTDIRYVSSVLGTVIMVINLISSGTTPFSTSLHHEEPYFVSFRQHLCIFLAAMQRSVLELTKPRDSTTVSQIAQSRLSQGSHI